MKKKFYLGFLFSVMLTTGILAQDQTASTEAFSRLSFSKISPNPFQEQFTFHPEADGKIVVFNVEGQRIEERHFSNGEILELGSSWPKGTYQLKIFGLGRTDFARIRKE